MKAIHWTGLLLLSGALVMAGCTGSEPKPAAEKQYPIKGKVVAVKPDKPSVRLDHEEIPGLMKGMEMEFEVADRKVLEGLRPGDQVHGHLKVRADRYIIIHLDKR